jgi:hypothetical protein
MNTNAPGLLLLAGFGFNPSWDSGDFCLKHRPQQEIPVCSAQNDFRNRLVSANGQLYSGPEAPASAVADQTDSPELIAFGYFPL